MLSALQQRWLAGTVYTAAGPVLLAVNPLEPQPGLSARVLLKFSSFKSSV